jgi:hypothetical protein
LALKFPKDTLDRIEQLFASKILKNFPYYGEFWEEFVGWNKNKEPLLLPYGLDFPSRIRQNEKERISESYQRMCVFHYSLFCQLAGAHFQLQQSVAALKENDDNKRHFLSWEAFDNLYVHLGNARFQMCNLWEEICKIACLPYSQNEDGLLHYLRDKNRNDLVQRVQEIRDNVIKIRNNIVHYARNMYVFIGGKYYIPLPIKKEPKLSEMLNHKEAQEATKKMETDLNNLEKLLNEVLPYMGRELEEKLDSSDIKVRR